MSFINDNDKMKTKGKKWTRWLTQYVILPSNQSQLGVSTSLNLVNLV